MAGTKAADHLINSEVLMFKENVMNFYKKIFNLHSKIKKVNSSESSDKIQNVTSSERVGTAPRTKNPLENTSQRAQDLVWDNEDASMQDKSYAFDEEMTDADYDLEDSLDFYDDENEQRQQKDQFE